MNELYIPPVLLKIIIITTIVLFLFGVGFGVRSYADMNVVEPIKPIETTAETTEPTEITEATEVVETTEVTETVEETIYIEPEPVETSSETIYVPTTEEVDSDVYMSDLEMLACVIYQEVGGDNSCDDCRRRVADIVLNRVASDEFPNTIYDVLMQEGQYGMFHWTSVKWVDRASNPGEAQAVERALRIAEEVLNGQHSELYGEGYVWQAGFIQGSDGFWCCGHFFGRG